MIQSSANQHLKSKIKLQKKWHPIIVNDTRLENKIHEIAHTLTINIKEDASAGLLTGLSGIALFFANYDLYCKQTVHTTRIEQLVSDAFSLIQTRWHPVSICSGLPGMLWAAEHLRQLGFLDMEIDAADTEDFLLQEMFACAEKNDFDFLHGATGILYYFLSREAEIDTADLEKFIALLQQFSITDEHGGIAWESLVDINDPKLVKNISLSHGISSIIILLSMAYERYRYDSIKKILEGTLHFLRGSRNKMKGL
jgi:lantibiotic modifying enzyme